MNIFTKKRISSSLEDWIFYAILLETFFIALSPGMATLALVAGVILWLVQLKVDKGSRVYRHLPFDVPVAIFALLGAASILVSPDKGFSFYNYYNLVGVYVLTYLLIGQHIGNAGQVRKMLIVLGAAAILVVLYGFYQYVFGIDTSAMKWVDGDAFPELKKRVFSTWENPNILAGYLDAAICLVFGCFIKMKEQRLRIVLGIGLLLLAACLAMTYARGACLTIAVVLVLYGVFKDWRILLGCLVVGGAILALDPALMERLSSVFTKVDTSSEMRLALWESTIAMIQDHPFLGIGWGAYWMVYPEYDFYLQGAAVRIVHAHNLYLNYSAEIGIAGALSFLWYFFGTMLMALRSKVQEASGLLQGLMLGVGLAIFSVALNGLTDDVLFNIPSSMLLWLLCALAAAAEKNI